MVAWDHRIATNWATLFGFVPVPLFGPKRKNIVAGDHFVLLDGRRSSLTFSHGKAADLLAFKAPAHWAWSANVPRSVIVDVESADIYAFRWDRPEDIRELRNARPESVQKLLVGLEYSTEEDEEETETSINHALSVFRSVRDETLQYGGTDLDAAAAFNVTLMMADRMRSDPNFTFARGLFQAAAQLRFTGQRLAMRHKFSPSVYTLPIGDLATQLLGERNDRMLDPYLLIRHAGGSLFQEANIQLKRPISPQPRLFVSLRRDFPRPRGITRPDAHYTPTPLARFLAEQALNEYFRLNPDSTHISILDPACGSGVFLVEALRELERTTISVFINGVDSSPIAKLMADFSTLSAESDFGAAGGSASIRIETGDSLKQDWGEPDVVLMNPPFLPWRSVDQSVRNSIRDALGNEYRGQSDTAVAFLAKAANELKPGGVLASVVPASLLSSDSGSALRKRLSGPGWHMVTIGRVRGYGYFKNATVEPAYLVLSKSTRNNNSTRTILSEAYAADEAIRAARITHGGELRDGRGWELGIRKNLNADDWSPRPEKANFLLRVFSEKAAVKVSTDLFDIRLGIRTGDNSVFVVTSTFLESVSATERNMFRPVANDIRRGRVQPTEYMFYPYRDGSLIVRSEKQLELAVPSFYTNQLLPNRVSLESRLSLRERHWWEPSEPRSTWLTFGKPKLVSMTFGRLGSFALDDVGAYAVLQGQAWIWRDQALTHDVWLSYLALLNSPLFEAMLDHFCPRTQGGQYELASRFLRQVPIPNLQSVQGKHSKRLAELGLAMHNGGRVSLHSLNVAVALAYGVSLEEFVGAFPLTEGTRLEMEFVELAAKWKKETGSLSSIAQKMRHPAMKRIIQMGTACSVSTLQFPANSGGGCIEILREKTGLRGILLKRKKRKDRGSRQSRYRRHSIDLARSSGSPYMVVRHTSYSR